MWLLDPLGRVLVLHVEWHTLANSLTEPGNSIFLFHHYRRSVGMFCENINLFLPWRGKGMGNPLFCFSPFPSLNLSLNSGLK